MSATPGSGGISSRSLHFIWICDCSGSMSEQKIQTLNYAIRSVIPTMQTEAQQNPSAQVFARAIKFSNGAQWHVAQPTPIEEFKWTDLTADGVTDMGKALSLVAEELKNLPGIDNRTLPPVLVLISDGQPTDDFSSGLKKLMEQPLGKKAVRIAIAVGGDADLETLQKFIGHSELQPLQANNAEALVRQIKWASTLVSAVALPRSQPKIDGGGNVPLPPVPQPSNDPTDDDWVY